jgi:hypothetical protein
VAGDGGKDDDDARAVVVVSAVDGQAGLDNRGIDVVVDGGGGGSDDADCLSTATHGDNDMLLV